MKEFRRFLYFGLLLYVCVSCSKDEDLLSNGFFEFETKCQLSHNSETLKMGDTLWFVSRIDGFLFDKQSSTDIFFSEGKITSNILIRSWNQTDYSYQDGAYNFLNVTKADVVTQFNEATMLGFTYERIGNSYNLEFGVVFNTPGIYSLDTDFIFYQLPSNKLPEYYGGGYAELTTSGNEVVAGVLFSTIESTNNNLTLYQSLSADEKNRFDEDPTENSNRYYFINVVN